MVNHFITVYNACLLFVEFLLYSGIVHVYADNVCHFLTEGGGTTRRDDVKQKPNG